MGKATGFMEFNRKNCNRENPLSRVNHWNEFEVPLTEEERREQGARCMDCGVPFCQSGVISVSYTHLIKSVERYFLLSSAKTVTATEFILLSSNAFTVPIKLAPEEIPTPSPNSLESF